MNRVQELKKAAWELSRLISEIGVLAEQRDDFDGAYSKIQMGEEVIHEAIEVMSGMSEFINQDLEALADQG